MSEREKIVEALHREWARYVYPGHAEEMLKSLDRAGYEVRPKVRADIGDALGFGPRADEAAAVKPPPVADPRRVLTISQRTEIEALCEKAKRDGAALALRASAATWRSCDPLGPRPLDVLLRETAARIERGEDVT